MSATTSHTSFDFDSNLEIVPVIASFDTNGTIRPLYVRINNESYRILSCRESESYGLRSFRCKIEDHGYVKELKLTYHYKEYVWTMPKCNV